MKTVESKYCTDPWFGFICSFNIFPRPHVTLCTTQHHRIIQTLTLVTETEKSERLSGGHDVFQTYMDTVLKGG